MINILIGYLGSLFPNDAKLLSRTVDMLNDFNHRLSGDSYWKKQLLL
jgi:hypothetical protein